MKKNDRAGLILLIEDNRNLSEVMGEFFEQKGFGVDFASDGLDGYRLACQNSYDVIVLDLNLPRMDGLQVCEKLRLEAKISTPILMLTARDAVPDKVLGFQAGADDYLNKPFDSEVLLYKIKAILQRKENESADEDNQFEFEVGDFHFDSKLRQLVYKGGQAIKLSPKENKLLKLLVIYKNDLLPRELALTKIW